MKNNNQLDSNTSLLSSCKNVKRGMLLVLIISIVLISGCKESGLFKGIPSAKIPGKCIEAKDDVCELFDCMVDRCWCDDANFLSPILQEGMKSIANEEEAKEVVWNYLQGPHEKGEKYGKLRSVEIKKVVRLNDIFYNVFADVDEEGDEEVFTVAVDGTIIKTICGV